MGKETLTLQEALRLARMNQAQDVPMVEQSKVKQTRLQELYTLVEPTFEEIPVNIDMFEFKLHTVDKERLWIDMAAFVEMSGNHKTFCLFQDNRTGRSLLKQTSDVDIMAKAVLDYVARRLIAREQLISMPLPEVLSANENEQVAFKQEKIEIVQEANLFKSDLDQNNELAPNIDKLEQIQSQKARVLVNENNESQFDSKFSQPITMKELRRSIFQGTKHQVELIEAEEKQIKEQVEDEALNGSPTYKNFIEAAKDAAREEAHKTMSLRQLSKPNRAVGEGILSRLFK